MTAAMSPNDFSGQSASALSRPTASPGTTGSSDGAAAGDGRPT
jgi:hypothetical protein